MTDVRVYKCVDQPAFNMSAEKIQQLKCRQHQYIEPEFVSIPVFAIVYVHTTQMFSVFGCNVSLKTDCIFMSKDNVERQRIYYILE